MRWTAWFVQHKWTLGVAMLLVAAVTAIVIVFDQHEPTKQTVKAIVQGRFDLHAATCPGDGRRETLMPPGPCRECHTNQHCGGQGVCDRRTGTCVQCVTDGDCATGQVCALRGGNTKSSHSICTTQCHLDSDCSSSNALGAAGGACVQGACMPCGSNTDCASGTVCDPQSAQCVECTGGRHCADGQVCSQATNTCVQGCNDKDCANGGVCVSGGCLPCDPSSAGCTGSGQPRQCTAGGTLGSGGCATVAPFSTCSKRTGGCMPLFPGVTPLHLRAVGTKPAEFLVLVKGGSLATGADTYTLKAASAVDASSDTGLASFLFLPASLAHNDGAGTPAPTGFMVLVQSPHSPICAISADGTALPLHGSHTPLRSHIYPSTYVWTSVDNGSGSLVPATTSPRAGDTVVLAAPGALGGTALQISSTGSVAWLGGSPPQAGEPPPANTAFVCVSGTWPGSDTLT